MKTSDKVRILANLTTRDEAGRHFTQRFSRADLAALEAEQLIAINRPVHSATGIPYDESHWTVEVTGDAQDLVDANPEWHEP